MPKKPPTPIDRQLGRLIKRARYGAGLSMVALGKKIGVAHNAVAKYERGEVPVTVARLALIARATEVHIDYFIHNLLRR